MKPAPPVTRMRVMSLIDSYDYVVISLLEVFCQLGAWLSETWLPRPIRFFTVLSTGVQFVVRPAQPEIFATSALPNSTRRATNRFVPAGFREVPRVQRAKTATSLLRHTAVTPFDDDQTPCSAGKSVRRSRTFGAVASVGRLRA